MVNMQPNQDPIGVFFWARSGGGHRTAKEGVKQQKVQEYAANGQQLDTTHDYDVTGEKVLSSIKVPFVGGLGELGVHAWDDAQKKGDLDFLRRYASFGWIGEIIFYPLVYFKVKALLQDLKTEPEFIVSTQAFCLKAMVHAMKNVNKEKNWHMHMDVYLTDLPSKKAIHFFPSIRSVTADKSLRKLLTLHAPPPLVKGSQTPEEFWKKYCGKINVVTDQQFPIRESFLDTKKLKEKLSKPDVEVKLKMNHQSEKAIIEAGLNSKATFTDDNVSLEIREKDKVAFLMLGSQPTTQSVLNWLRTVRGSSELAGNKDQHQYFFLYCGSAHTDTNRNPLLDAVQADVVRMKKAGMLPPQLSIIPFTNQGADEIALLMARSDISITRSGGATSMELLQLEKADLPKRADKLTLIHSEAQLFRGELAPTYDRDDFVRRMTEDISTLIGKHSLLTERDWAAVKNGLSNFCKQLGYTTKKSQIIVENILRCYTSYSSEEDKPDLSKLLKSLEKYAKMRSKTNVSRERKIEKEMKIMQHKTKYKGLALSVLRQNAIEKILIKDGIVLWEGGNAKYLQKKLGAHVVTPQYAKQFITKAFG